MDRGTILPGFRAYIRTGPSRQYPLIDPNNEYNSLLMDGVSFDIYEYSNGWFRHSRGGWSPETDNGLQIYDIQKNVGENTQSNTTATTTPPSSNSSSSEEDTNEYSIYNEYNSKYDEQTSASLFVKDMRGVIGMPYQFMSSVDPRLTDSIYGRKYAEKIASKMPILLMSPGRPKFMKDFSPSEKKDVLRAIASGDTSNIEGLINGTGKFYSFQSNYVDYYEGVNQMCRLAAKLLDIGNVTIPCGNGNSRLSSMRWENYANDAFKSFFASGPDTLGFYIDSEKQITETFNNETSQSMLGEKVNSLSELGREMQFLLGGVAGIEMQKFTNEAYDETLEEFNNFANTYLSILPSTLISRLTSGFMTVAVGGKMLFPEMWSDSTYSKNFSVNMKLRSPDADELSIYLNILVPLFHLINFAGAQQLGKNAYSSPFLVRAHFKSMFTVDMGIITSMSIARGNESKWTASGLPTEVDVSFDIKDLYPVMMMLQKADEAIYNTGLVDYVANLCGINMNKPDILRMGDIYISKFLHDKNIVNRVSKTFLKVEQAVNNSLRGIYDSFFKRY